MKRLLALTYKDLLIIFSYRLEFILRFFGVFFTVTLWYFLSRVVGSNHPNYYGYVVIGIAMQTYLSAHLYGAGSRIRNEQVTGTLESVLATPTPPSMILMGGMVADFINAFITFVLMMIWAGIIGDMNLNIASYPAVMLSLVLTALAFTALGSLSAWAVIVFQKGDPFSFFMVTMQALLGTVFFPLDVMPAWLQAVGEWMPMTQGLRALRGSLLNGATTGDLAPSLLYLLLFSAGFFVIGDYLFRSAIRRARRSGSLGRF